MKRKKISLLCALLSLAVALTYVTLAVVLTFRVISAKEYVPTADSNLWVIKVLQRLKATSFNLFFSMIGIILAVMLALYRTTLVYFYYKVSKSDDVFYKARLGEIIFFSVLSAFVVGVLAWFCFVWDGVFPPEVQPIILALFFAYILLCILPILEILFVYSTKIFKKKSKQAVPTKKDVMEELDELADKTAQEIAQKKEEKKVQEPIPVQPVAQIVQTVRERKVAEYVTPYWDREDDATIGEKKSVDNLKTSIRKKKEKISYSSATLRIKKPLSNRKRLKIMSPAVNRLRYEKTCRLVRYDGENRK